MTHLSACDTQFGDNLTELCTGRRRIPALGGVYAAAADRTAATSSSQLTDVPEGSLELCDGEKANVRIRSSSGMLLDMFRHSKLALCLWVLAIALMAVRISGAHVHLCSDGQEAAASLHLLDSAPHHAGDEDIADHQDRDLKISDAAIFKKNDTGSDLMPLLVSLIFLLVLPHIRVFIPAASSILLPTGPRLYFTPPMRGPPL